MLANKKIKLAAVAIMALSLTACTGNNDNTNPLLRLAKNIVSTRSQSSTHNIAVLKLKIPAVLENAKIENGKTVIDADILAAVNKEQQEVIASLKALSPEVQILFQYKMVLNALTVYAPVSVLGKIKELGIVASIESSGTFARPKSEELTNNGSRPDFLNKNSSKFIGAELLNSKGITGKGIKVGILDTGIDYTHSMLGGAGTEEAFKAVNPSENNSAFPNKKVVGGIDLVGTAFDSGSEDFLLHIPKPDMNPIDEGGHGTHVAGTVAGRGDSINTYNGMAPDADLYAIKVFGADGSTSDFIVIAGLEYSMDPNADGNLDDRLDVVNLSLGSGYGNPHILYSEAVKNLTKGGIVAVISAGNSGHTDYIVGSPGTADEALSVAASVDDGDHLWKFSASSINLGSEVIHVEAIEAATTKKVADSDVKGKFVFIGDAARELTEEQKAAVNGNVALIDRGVVTFNDKIKRAADAGAIGVVVANNREGAAFVMGSSDEFSIPAIMIALPEANKIKEAMKSNDVIIQFKTDVKIEKPELIDTLTSFTSKGPRSVDGAIKPEISAPGESVISAKMGGGAKAVQMSGTSMAAPHMAGVMALIKQAHPNLSALDLKSIAMGTSKTIGENNERYSISLQGAGRVQADKAVDAGLVVQPSALSFGIVALESKKALRREITVKNISDKAQTYQLSFEGNGFISMSSASEVTVEAKSQKVVSLSFVLDSTNFDKETVREMDGWVKLTQNGQEVYRVPALAVANKLSNIKASGLTVQATSEVGSAGAAAELSLNSKSSNKGEVLLFNLIAQDNRKPSAPSYMSTDCDLQAAGYKIVSRDNEQGGEDDVLQVAVKVFKPMTTWNACDISLLIDADGDGKPEQELLGSHISSIPNLSIPKVAFLSTLLDATKTREIRKNFEVAIKEAKQDPKKIEEAKQKLSYIDAILDAQQMSVYNNSTVVVLETLVKNLAKSKDNSLKFKLLVTHNEQSSVEFDDYLSSSVKKGLTISLDKNDQAFVDLPGALQSAGVGSQSVPLTKGTGRGKLLVLMPNNLFSVSDSQNDSQMQVLAPKYNIQ